MVYAHDVDGQLQAWAYLPKGDHGQPPGVHDLNDLVSFCGIPPCESAAWDINDAGIIVGQRNGAGIGEGEAMVWQLGPTVTACPLGYLGGTFQWSVAYAVNNAEPAVGIGDSTYLTDPPCDSANFAFRVSFDPECLDNSLEVLMPVDLDDGAYARAVNTTADPRDTKLVGFSFHEVLPSTCQNGLSCSPEKDPLRWRTLTPVEAQLNRLSGGGGHEARGINDAGQIVGVGFDAALPECLNHAVFWESDSVEVPLERDAQGVWTVADLQDESDVPPNWELVDAHDVNDKGCIVGWGREEVSPSEFVVHAYLLCEGCVSDCGVLDCRVNTEDLLALLAQWGQIGSSCDFGLPGPGVGTAELLELLSHWGSCCAGTPTSVPQDVQDCLNKFCCEPENMLALDACLCAVDPESCE